jgi:hypothetical protein
MALPMSFSTTWCGMMDMVSAISNTSCAIGSFDFTRSYDLLVLQQILDEESKLDEGGLNRSEVGSVSFVEKGS